jgi:DNA-binding transcriptional MocR family regulator
MQLAADPSIISFAGGMPANALFPIDTVDELWNALSREAKQVAMQYGPTPGFPPLLEALREYLKQKGLPLENQGLIITTGAQQAINLLAKVLIDPGDIVVTENPGFIGALAAFLSYLARIESAPLDNDGIVINELEKALDAHGSKVKMLYLNPCFQNPAGIIYSIERKKALLELLAGRNLCLLEDDPYSELYFDEKDRRLTVPLKAMGKEPLPICYTGSFAKILGPGLRLGWLLGPAEIIEKCELAKQSMDACSSTFTQVIANDYLRKGKLPGYLRSARTVFARRAATMLAALDATMPPEVTWTHPKGGFYIWVTMPESIDATKVFNEAIAQHAAFVIGSAFDPAGTRNNSFRLAFSHTAEGSIARGVEIIAQAIRKFI